MALVSRQVTVKHHQRRQKDAHSILSRSTSSKLAENQSDSGCMYTLGTALQAVLCCCCSPGSLQRGLRAERAEPGDSPVTLGSSSHRAELALLTSLALARPAVPVVAAQAEPLEQLKLADVFFWDGSQCSRLIARHSPLCTAECHDGDLGTHNSSGIILLLPSVEHPSSCPQAHRDGHEARTRANSEMATRSLTNIMAMPFVFQGSEANIPGIVTIVLVMNNLNFVPYSFPKPQLQNFQLRPSPARRHETMDGCI